jgi:hypothetical protein
MHRHPKSVWVISTALLAALTVFVVSNAAVVPGPWHDGRNCDLCRSGHQPTLTPPLRVEIPIPFTVEWRVPADEQDPLPDPSFRTDAPRAPPA